MGDYTSTASKGYAVVKYLVSQLAGVLFLAAEEGIDNVWPVMGSEK